MKTKFPREWYIPKGATKVTAKNSSAVVYLCPSTNGSKLAALGFVGNQSKPAFHYSFRDEARRTAFLTKWFADQAASEARRAAAKSERRAFKRTLKVGDVLRAAWGYDQTNIDYVEVTALIGDSMVEVREIAQEIKDTGFMSGQCVPVPGRYTDKQPMRRRVTAGNCVRLNESARAYKCEPIETVPGVKVFRPSYWSSYA